MALESKIKKQTQNFKNARALCKFTNSDNESNYDLKRTRYIRDGRL